ncbi:MAG: hypothetical protein ACXVCP_18885 [Bdellovibrio sp.]
MKTFFALFAFLTSFSAYATPAHPCAPVVQARPITISCSDNGVYYGIRVFTRMSDARLCPVDQLVEVKTATVIVGDFEGHVSQTLNLLNGEFSYTLSAIGDATFVSEKASLNLNNCSTPLPGGFSVGN